MYPTFSPAPVSHLHFFRSILICQGLELLVLVFTSFAFYLRIASDFLSDTGPSIFARLHILAYDSFEHSPGAI